MQPYFEELPTMARTKVSQHTSKVPGRAKGGVARAEALSPERRREIAVQAARARHSRRATTDGTQPARAEAAKSRLSADERDIRRRNIVEVLKVRPDVVSVIANEAEQEPQALFRIPHTLTGTRKIRRLEAVLGLEAGWMDANHSTEELRGSFVRQQLLDTLLGIENSDEDDSSSTRIGPVVLAMISMLKEMLSAGSLTETVAHRVVAELLSKDR